MNAVISTDNATGAIIHADGIHFGLAEDRYHGDPALGSTTIKELVIDPIEYQHGKLHGGEKRETFRLKWGSAIHCRVLEGRSSFARRFAVLPAVTDYDKPLVTMDDLKAYCRTLSLKPGNSKDSAIQAIRDFDTEVPIWDEIVARFKEENKDKEHLPRDAFVEIERAAMWMQRDRLIAPVMEDGTFTAGASEVSIFYTENGVRFKARIDHLLSHAALDLKSFRPMFAESIHSAAKRAIARMRYDTQAAAYLRALRHAAKLYADGKVFSGNEIGSPYPHEFLDEVFKSLASGEFKWIWVLIKATGAPQSVVAEFEMKSLIFKNAAVDVEDAIKAYRKNIKRFGVNEDWVPDTVAQIWGDGDFPPYAFQ